eukprot:8921405-Lingulodinium_polyedra.AAC.1
MPARGNACARRGVQHAMPAQGIACTRRGVRNAMPAQGAACIACAMPCLHTCTRDCLLQAPA